MPRLYLRVEYDTDTLLEKLREIDTKTRELEDTLREFQRLCSQFTAAQAECENSEADQEQKNN